MKKSIANSPFGGPAVMINDSMPTKKKGSKKNEEMATKKSTKKGSKKAAC